MIRKYSLRVALVEFVEFEFQSRYYVHFWFGLMSLFNGISIFMGYLVLKQSYKRTAGEIGRVKFLLQRCFSKLNVTV